MDKTKERSIYEEMVKHDTEEDIRNSFSMHNKCVDSWEVEQKIINTIKFFNETRDLK